MLIKVLGAAAGGGFPQWNCNGPMSSHARAKKDGFRSRTQSSLAVSAEGDTWVLLNCSPDLRQQIAETPDLWPKANGPLRNSPIQAVILTNADVDHIIGLINLREAHPFTIYASRRVLDTINSNSVFNVCNPDIVPRLELPLNQPIQIRNHGIDLGLTVEAFAVPGKIALFLEEKSDTQSFGSREGDTIGLKITATKTGKDFFYVPGCADVDAPLRKILEEASLLFFDGTLFKDDEMIEQGLLNKTGARMGHISMSGEQGSLEIFKKLGIKRKIYIHINNSNPVLNDHSAERKQVEKMGWEVSYDGMEIRI